MSLSSPIKDTKKNEESRYNGMSDISDYAILEQLGQGTFGIVSKARQKSTNKLVALKKLIIHDTKDGFPITAFREICIMKKFRNVNVLQLIDMIHESTDDIKKPGFFYTVTPYISSDLNGLLNNPRVTLTVPHIKCIMIQILRGINYIHNMNYLHRDIKTANILLDYFGVVKIADFGLARIYHGSPPSKSTSLPGGGKFEYTGVVVTRWYRPPELLLGERKYTTAVDMWGIGCVLGELFKKKPILEGQSDLDQADLIFKLLGSPKSEMSYYQSINKNKVNLSVSYSRSIEKEYGPIMPAMGLELLSGLLNLDPTKRFNAVKALDSEFFKSEPLPCEPEQLPKFEESHESDVKKFREEKRKGALTVSSNKSDYNSLEHSKYGINGISLNDTSMPHLTQHKNQVFSNSVEQTRVGSNSSVNLATYEVGGITLPLGPAASALPSNHSVPVYTQPKQSWTAAHASNSGRRWNQNASGYQDQWNGAAASTSRSGQPFKIQSDSRYPEFGHGGFSHNRAIYHAKETGYSKYMPLDNDREGDLRVSPEAQRRPPRVTRPSQQGTREHLHDDGIAAVHSSDKLYTDNGGGGYSAIKQYLHSNKKREPSETHQAQDLKKIKK